MQDNHKRFADKYFETLNASESAIYSGYAADSAKQTGYRLLQRDDVENYLSELKNEAVDISGITKQRWLKELERSGFSDIRKILNVDGGLKDASEWDDDTAAAIESIELFEVSSGGEKIGTNKKIKLVSKLASLDKIGRHLGFFEKDNEQSRSINTMLMNIDPLSDIENAGDNGTT